MYSTICTGGLKGVYAYLVYAEVDIAQGLPSFEMVGYLGNEVREAKERVRVALKNNGICLPTMRITINLSPADIRKAGTGFDLPIAVGLLRAMGKVEEKATEGLLFVGELGLSGEVKKIKGVLPIVQEAKNQGIRTCIVPLENAKEGAVISDIDVIGVSNLKEVLEFLSLTKEMQKEKYPPQVISLEELLTNTSEDAYPNFGEIYGQEAVKRGAEVAAAGFHHMLMLGPPGTGKTMIGKRIPGILPRMTRAESLEVSNIYSAQGLLGTSNAFITKRPFIDPHHTISSQALAGGGRIPTPGAVSLAHRGILFLDELPEFPRKNLDILRQPLEDKKVVVSRAYGSYTFPADFMLVCAMNPCPCGYYPDINKCRCTEHEVRRYLAHVSGPILDRMDICVEASEIGIQKLRGDETRENSRTIRERVIVARERQEKRFEGTQYRFNSEILAKDINKYCPLGEKEERLLEELFKNMPFSARGYYKILKLARTIADLSGSKNIEELHLAEAVCFRMTDEKYWKGGR